jgi:hypothetical protein
MDDGTFNCHGVELPLPVGWSNETVFRFALPPAPPVAPNAPQFRTNAVAVMRGTDPKLTIEEALRGMRASSPAKPSEVGNFKVRVGQLAKADALPPDAPPALLGCGLGNLGSERAAFLDVSFYSPEAQRRLYQRQIVALPLPGRMLVFTLTGTDAELDPLARELGFRKAT